VAPSGSQTRFFPEPRLEEYHCYPGSSISIARFRTGCNSALRGSGARFCCVVYVDAFFLGKTAFAALDRFCGSGVSFCRCALSHWLQVRSKLSRNDFVQGLYASSVVSSPYNFLATKHERHSILAIVDNHSKLESGTAELRPVNSEEGLPHCFQQKYMQM
jgi:hypothetical protein